MLISGNLVTESKSSNDLNNLDKFLEQDTTNNQNEPWSKLDKTTKTKKILAFAETYSTENCYDEDEQSQLIVFLKECLDRKRFQRVKDVIYNKTTGEIKDVPALFYNKPTKHFTLKNIEKRISTLKSLPPKKVRGTIKNTKSESCDSDNESEQVCNG